MKRRAAKSASVNPRRPGERQLMRAYARTTFRAYTTAGTIDIRAGHRNAQLERLLRTQGVNDWAFITAENPKSVRVSAAVNRTRRAKLRRVVKALGFQYMAGVRPLEAEDGGIESSSDSSDGFSAARGRS
jgi:hypothetical protein